MLTSSTAPFRAHTPSLCYSQLRPIAKKEVLVHVDPKRHGLVNAICRRHLLSPNGELVRVKAPKSEQVADRTRRKIGYIRQAIKAKQLDPSELKLYNTGIVWNMLLEQLKQPCSTKPPTVKTQCILDPHSVWVETLADMLGERISKNFMAYMIYNAYQLDTARKISLFTYYPVSNDDVGYSTLQGISAHICKSKLDKLRSQFQPPYRHAFACSNSLKAAIAPRYVAAKRMPADNYRDSLSAVDRMPKPGVTSVVILEKTSRREVISGVGLTRTYKS